MTENTNQIKFEKLSSEVMKKSLNTLNIVPNGTKV